MKQAMPRILTVAANGPTTLRVKWRDAPDRVERIDLAGWIGTGGDVLKPLRDPKLFGRPAVADYGAAVAWGDDDDELRIDAVHLASLGAEQRPFGAKEAAAWQSALDLSNHEAAELIGVAVSTWSAYKVGAKIPTAVAMLCRAAQRDPIVMQAHFRPRKAAGRPRRSA